MTRSCVARAVLARSMLEELGSGIDIVIVCGRKARVQSRFSDLIPQPVQGGTVKHAFKHGLQLGL